MQVTQPCRQGRSVFFSRQVGEDNFARRAIGENSTGCRTLLFVSSLIKSFAYAPVGMRSRVQRCTFQRFFLLSASALTEDLFRRDGASSSDPPEPLDADSLDARTTGDSVCGGAAVAIRHIKLENEGWEWDYSWRRRAASALKRRPKTADSA